MSPKQMHDNLERWLVHENFRFKETPSEQDSFKIIIKHVGGFGHQVEIFQPVSQPGVLVFGSRVPLQNNQNARYLKLSPQERENFEKKVSDFCTSIRAINRMLEENGKKIIGVYIVLDKEESFNQKTVIESIEGVAEMGDKASRFLMKTF